MLIRPLTHRTRDRERGSFNRESTIAVGAGGRVSGYSLRITMALVGLAVGYW